MCNFIIIILINKGAAIVLVKCYSFLWNKSIMQVESVQKMYTDKLLKKDMEISNLKKVSSKKQFQHLRIIMKASMHSSILNEHM